MENKKRKRTDVGQKTTIKELENSDIMVHPTSQKMKNQTSQLKNLSSFYIALNTHLKQ
jgi:hypothetical protein